MPNHPPSRHAFPTISRRAILRVAAASLCAATPLAAQASRIAGNAPSIHVLKDPDCGCCTAWIDTLRPAGINATVELADPARLARFKQQGGIPQALQSCHTGQIETYLIEGHVPATDILRLLRERPDAIGLSVPGMPWGSPGMGPESEREAYDVILIGRDGATSVFSSYPAA